MMRAFLVLVCLAAFVLGGCSDDARRRGGDGPGRDAGADAGEDAHNGSNNEDNNTPGGRWGWAGHARAMRSAEATCAIR